MRLVAVFVTAALLTSLTLGLSIAAFVVSRPTAVPAAVTPVPAVLATGVMCTYAASRFETLNATCFPAGFNETTTLAYCRARRNVSDVPCVIAACTAYVTDEVEQTVGDANPLRAMSFLRYRFELYNTNRSDIGTVRVAHVVQQFMIENRPEAITPLILPPPQPLETASANFSVAQVGVANFRIASRELARQYVAFYWNFMGNTRSELASSVNLSPVARHSVVTPARCPYPAVADLPWLQGNHVTVSALYNLAFQMIILNPSATNDTTAEGWPAYCAVRMASAPSFCNAFPSYYAYESLRNYTMVPSPYRDLTSVLTAYNEEYADCGPARGCFGYTA